MDFEKLHREESGRALATLIRVLGDFDLAEEMLQEAFAAALEQWPREGPPASPRAWLVSTARHKAIDHLRRRSWFEAKREELARSLESWQPAPGESADQAIADDQLRLIFTCCHPALAPEAQVALTLRSICGLSTDEVARAFLVSSPTMAQRLVRAKNKIRDAGIPYRVPPSDEIAERLHAAMQVVYLIFNEGYAATAGDRWIRHELCTEAIRLGRMLCELLPERYEACALLALMLLHDSRHAARESADGDIITLEEQDRSLWDRDKIREGISIAESALQSGAKGEYAIQAAIAALHAKAACAAQTDWRQIAALYSYWLRIQPSPVVELNRAVAVGMAEGPEKGIELLRSLEDRNELPGYHWLPAARGDFLRRLNRQTEAAQAYSQALELATNEAERRFLNRRLLEVNSR